MEVHHHTPTESPPAGRAGKKWTHYLWEFLMLFLAVFCGFLAEYALEHKIEKDREKQYIASMLEDIAADTLMLTQRIQAVKTFPEKFDSISTILYKNDHSEADISKAYLLQIQYSNYLLGITFVNRTTSQLKNAGGMRLIRKKKVADAITQYWESTALLELNNQNYETYRKEVLNFSYRIFSREFFSKPLQFDHPVLVRLPVFMNNDPVVLKEYANRVNHLSVILINFYLPNMKNHIAFGKEVIEIIKKEYKLK